ncbi:RE1 [Symbiodinium microadriaticum]|nr:RE1 [Symbiodinium microadriaticum]
MTSTEPKSEHYLRCSWDGEASGWVDFTRKVRLAFEQTPRKRRHLLGPQVVGQLSGRAWSITGDLDHRRLCRRDGVIYLLQYLKESLGKMPIPDIGLRLEMLILRLRRQPHQSMATWAAHVRQQYRHLQIALARVRRREESTREPGPSSSSRASASTGASPQRRASTTTVEKPQAEQGADAEQDEEETRTEGPAEEELVEESPSSWRRRKTRRDSEDSDTSAKALEDLQLWDAQEEQLPEVLPTEVLGWLLLRRASLTNQSRLSVQAAASNSLRFEDVEKALRGMEDELVHQETQHRHGGKGEGRRRTFWVEDNGEWSLLMGDQTEMEDKVETGEVMYIGPRLPPQVYSEEQSVFHSDWSIPEEDWWNAVDGHSSWDDTSWWNWDEYDDLLSPEEHKEVDEAYALAESKVRNFVQARQAVKARNLSRGFYPFAPQGKSIGKGKKGKSKTRFKGKTGFSAGSSSPPAVMATSSEDQGFLGAAVGQPGYTGCFICGAKDHDFRSCPRRSQKGGKGKASTVHYAEASVFTVTTDPNDDDEMIPTFMSQGVVEGPELEGYAVLDTGATETVGSLPAIEQLMKLRHRHLGYAEDFHVVDKAPKRFKFGNGETAFSASYLLLPQQLGDHEVHLGIYTLDVTGVPVLVGIKTLHRLGAVLDLAKFVVVFTSVDIARAIQLQRSPSGHALLDLRGDWLSRGCLVSDLGRSIVEAPCTSEKLVESACMVLDSELAEEVEDSEIMQQNVHDQSVNEWLELLFKLNAIDRNLDVVPKGKGKSKPKKESIPLDYDRTEQMDPRDPRATGGLCKGNHCPKVRSNQYAQWTICTRCQVRISYTPRMGCHAMHRQAGPLSVDTKEMLEDLPQEAEACPTNRDISLQAAENSALRQLERVRRLRDGNKSATTKGKAEDVPSKSLPVKAEPKVDPKAKVPVVPVEDDSDLEEVSPLSKSFEAKRQHSRTPGVSKPILNNLGEIIEQNDQSVRSRTPGVSEPILNNLGGPFYVRLENAASIEGVCTEYLKTQNFSHQALEYVLMNLEASRKGPTRGVWSDARASSLSLTLGLFAHGNQYGITRATLEYPQLCRFVNRCVAHWFPGQDKRWTSISLLLNVQSKLHKDNHNYHASENLTCSYGDYRGGELWLQASEENVEELPKAIRWRSLPTGERAPGTLVVTKHSPMSFWPKVFHGPMPWAGTRGSVTAFTARSITSIDQNLRQELRKLGFPMPPKCEEAQLHDKAKDPEDEYDLDPEEVLTDQNKRDILAQIMNTQEALEEIMIEYPNPPRVQVAQVCGPWFEPDKLYAELDECGLCSMTCGFAEGCDLTTNYGYQKTLSELKEKKPEWMWCHVPQGPSDLFPEVFADRKIVSKAKKFLKVMAVDTTPLNTLTAQELEKLMSSVRKLHRRFGHPSNQLLIKNLKARNADPVVIAAASQLQCDECQEGKIRLPAPAVNLERTDKLWDCLQVDGFDMRIGSQVHHFVLMVDEASGYAVIREAFRHPEDEGRNLTGEEFVSILREAWFGYFGYPTVLKLDLEGAHRSTRLAQECLDNGIEIVAAPAEHHQTIAEVERMIGHIRHKVETFVREQPVDPKIAAITMVMTHNSLARNHGFSPLQWALGRDWSPGDRLLETDMDVLSSSTTSPFGATVQLRAEAAKAFVEHRARDLASRAKNSKTRSTTSFLPGDLVFYRRLQHPADLPANSLVDRPRLRLSRWYGPARVLATETKNEGTGRRPSAIVWGIAGGREYAMDDDLIDSVADKGQSENYGEQLEVQEALQHLLYYHLLKRDATTMGPAEELHEDWTVDQLLNDVSVLPPSLTPPSFQEQRRLHEQQDRPWHVQHRGEDAMMVDVDRTEGIYSVVIDIPEDERAWKRILKDPSKFLAKSVQKGVEVAWAKLNDQQRAAMQEAKKAELESWVAKKVVQAAAPDITEDQALRMRWIYTFKAAGDQHPGKLKAKARIVILGFSDPSLLEQDTASPSLTRLSKMLLLNMATARRWRVLSGDVKTAFLQAKSPDRAHPLHARPLPELSEAMGLPPERMVELLGSAYGLTSAPREWFIDLTGTIKKLRGQRCHTDPCLWRIYSEAKEIVGIVGIFVDDLLFAGDEESSEWITFLQELHSHYEWSPWETDSFTHCGIKITQDNDEAIHLDHSSFSGDLSQMQGRKKGEDHLITDQELSQARAILGSAQWRVTQTAPHHAAKLSLLQSSLSTREPHLIEQVNKLVREIHMNRFVSVKVQQLNPHRPDDLHFIGFSDAALANRPGGGSTGGFVLGLIHSKDLSKGEGAINLVSWRSSKLHRIARSSLAAEAQALSELEQEAMYARLTWYELLGGIVDPNNPASAVRTIPATLVVDAKAMFDALEKGEIASSAYSMRDKYTALELMSVSQHFVEQSTMLQWCDSDHQAADGMTKSQKQDAVRKLVATGRWRFRLDGAFISAKKRKAMNRRELTDNS